MKNKPETGLVSSPATQDEALWVNFLDHKRKFVQNSFKFVREKMSLCGKWVFLGNSARSCSLRSFSELFLKQERITLRGFLGFGATRANARASTSTLSRQSSSGKERTRRADTKGIDWIRRGKKKKDPDDEFMNLWHGTETHLRDRIRANIRHKNDDGRNMGKAIRNRTQFKNLVSLPGEAEIGKDEKDLLLDDDDFTYKIPFIKPPGSPVESKPQDDQMEDKVIKEQSLPEGSSFEEIGVHPKLIEKLRKDGVLRPVTIQEIALPLVYQHKSILIKSETGSGKSLVFLLPTVQDPGRGCGTVIIVPTRELASQMLYEVYRLLGDKSIVASFVSGVDSSHQEACLRDADHLPRIVIGTPKRLLEIVQEHESLFTRTKRIIIDEVDKTFLPLPIRASRKKITNRFLHPRPGRLLVEELVKASKVKKIQLIGATATVSTVLMEELVDLGWGDHVTVVQPPSLEGKLRSVPECITHRYSLYDEGLFESKAHILARVFASSKQKSALVFIRRNHSVDDFVWELRYLGLNAVALYKQIATQDPQNYRAFLSDFKTGKTQLVIGTEETVRGLDFPDLEHVYLMEVPKNAEEYLHLAGRVGRQGRRGTTTTIVTTDADDRRMRLVYRRLGVAFHQI